MFSPFEGQNRHHGQGQAGDGTRSTLVPTQPWSNTHKIERYTGGKAWKRQSQYSGEGAEKWNNWKMLHFGRVGEWRSQQFLFQNEHFQLVWQIGFVLFYRGMAGVWQKFPNFFILHFRLIWGLFPIFPGVGGLLVTMGWSSYLPTRAISAQCSKLPSSGQDPAKWSPGGGRKKLRNS